MLLPWLAGHVHLRPTGQDGKELNMPFICEQRFFYSRFITLEAEKVITATCADKSLSYIQW